MNDIKYDNGNFTFVYRVSVIIFNKEKTKILLFQGNDMDFYMLPGGKVHELEKSEDAIKREIFEEIGYKNLKYKFAGTSEEIVSKNGVNIHEITFTYKSVYKNEIEERFKGKENDWMNFEWVDINKIDNYKIHPTNIKEMINSNKVEHIVEVLYK